MHREMRATNDAGSKQLLGILFLLTPSVLAFASVFALSRNASPASALWFPYEVTRLIAYVGIIIAAGLALEAATRRISGFFVALMILFTGSGTLLLWYTVHIFRSPW